MGTLLYQLLKKILYSFGFYFVTYVGFTTTLNLLKNHLMNTLQGISVDIFNILMLSGLGTGLGYIFGAIAFKISMTTLSKLSTRPNK